VQLPTFFDFTHVPSMPGILLIVPSTYAILLSVRGATGRSHQQGVPVRLKTLGREDVRMWEPFSEIIDFHSTPYSYVLGYSVLGLR
jgi:hypothetical protein